MSVAIDYSAALMLRQMALVQNELPKYLLAPAWPFVQLATLKQRAEKAARTAGRAPAGSQAHRLVPLSDHQYVSQLQMM
ncbi:resolvase, partial [Klebsiella pneumoniae]